MQDEKLAEIPSNSGSFRLIRLILIDSYSRNRTVEINLDGHISLTGENASGKTTLLRLLPIFFGEAPSRVIQSDDNNHNFGRHYFPTTASYVVYEYDRRGSKVLSVIHPDGQSDGVVYRFIDSPYRPDLFRDAGGPVQCGVLTRHLAKLGVFESKPLPLTAYRNILHNTAGREYRQLASRFSFIGSGGQLTHIERVITAILQRATTFHDLKRMIVSTIQDRQEAFSMRTGKRELLHWIAEYEAHHAVMEKASVMDSLERDDALRRTHEEDFSRLHAGLHLLHDHLQALVIEGGVREKELADERERKVVRYNEQLQDLLDKLTQQNSAFGGLRDTLSDLEKRKRRYDGDSAIAKALLVDAIPAKEVRFKDLSDQVRELEGTVRSIAEVFERMENDTQRAAAEEKNRFEEQRTQIVQDGQKKSTTAFEQQRAELGVMRDRHREETERQAEAVSTLLVEEGRLDQQVKTPACDPELEAMEVAERERQKAASEALEALRDATEALEKVYKKCQSEFEDAEELVNGSDMAVEKIAIEMQGLIDAGNAGENTLLGFLRTHKPDWHLNIGRLLPEETLLRSDLAPSLSGGDDLYGVSIAVEHIAAGRLVSEESIQTELQRLRALIGKRKEVLEADRKSLSAKGVARETAKNVLNEHEAKIVQAKQAKQEADRRVQVASGRVELARASVRRTATMMLEDCRARLQKAKNAAADQKRLHANEIEALEAAHALQHKALKSEQEIALQVIANAVLKVGQELQLALQAIAKQRDASLAEKGIDVSVLNELREQLKTLENELNEARSLSSYVLEYRTWLESSWSKRAEHEAAAAEAERLVKNLKTEHEKLLVDRADDLKTQDDLIKKAKTATDAADASRRSAAAQMHLLSNWPKDAATLEAGFDPSLSVESLGERRRELQRSYDEIQVRIRNGVDSVRRAMMASIGTGPERFHSTAQHSIGFPVPAKEYLWIEGLRSWFNHEHANNRASVIQLGKTMALNISAFWTGLGQFKKDVANFASDLRAHLHQGKLFANIADVSALITTEVDKQGYWQVVETLHYEYEAWHSQGDNNLPPPGFIDAARGVAAVIGDEKGLVADPVDLISLQITATIDGDGNKVAKNEAALARMSSNGLSYVILCFILLGFINRIRRKEPVQIPFVVDELKDLSQANATALLNLLARNHVTLISAFPDVDPDLAPLFARNYKIQPGRMLATVVLEEEEEANV